MQPDYEGDFCENMLKKYFKKCVCLLEVTFDNFSHAILKKTYLIVHLLIMLIFTIIISHFTLKTNSSLAFNLLSPLLVLFCK